MSTGTSARSCGTRAKYVVERCRCEDCRRAVREYERQRRRAQMRPDETWQPYVDAVPVRAHLRWLSSCGIGWKTAAALAGVPTGSVSKLLYGDARRGMGPSKGVRAETARRLMSIKPSAVPIPADSRRTVDATRTRALLDDLVRRGWPKAELARRLGSRTPCLQVGRAERVWISTARKVEALHAELSRTAPVRRSRWSA